MENKEIRVGIADLNTVSSPGKLITVGLGSCVGIALYDSISKIGGLSHIMLPDSTQFNNVANPYKFADLAIPILIEKLLSLGCNKRNLKAKIVGGASMFNFSDKSMTMDIGNRNGIAVKAALQKQNIPLISEDLGGNRGRTMILDADNGSVCIRTVGLDIKNI
ncbi:chemotaxis protein CheD [Clostridium sp. 19966]|uniref:chemotaxis protein CheD n=1 Tax=Clostridium sp. 19966 TaxID=2768166 RepID=UPI0028DFF57B|nr:chemotaxis protein CheD [Clostridium sp. 19966]MDT8716684.1 chemotaxis protein CheD [Clostridium sp. 19966]